MKHVDQWGAVTHNTVAEMARAAIFLRWCSRAALLVLGLLINGLAHADDARLSIAIEGGAFNSKFKFYNASDGCPGYNDLPGAKDFMGGVLASSTPKTKVLPTDTPIHVFLFRPRDTPGISAGGGQAEIRRRSLQVVLTGDAELVITGFEDSQPQWTASGAIEVQRADACATPEDTADTAAPTEEALPEETLEEDAEDPLPD